MEVEVKLRLLNPAAYNRVKTLLAPFHRRTERQENFFFDGARGELSSKRAALRLRFSRENTRCVVSLKANAVLVNGVSRVEEDEEEVRDVEAARACVEEAERLKGLESRVLRRVLGEFGKNGDLGFVGLGGFRNLREVYEWKGLKLEVDETDYAFGTNYEIECESVDPEDAKKTLEEFLNENGIEHSDSLASKFAIFRAGKLP